MKNWTRPFIKSIPRDHQRLDIVANSYVENSIKTGARFNRGNSERIIIFHKFMLNGENKRRQIEIMFQYIVDNRIKALNILRCSKIYLSSRNECKSITLSSVSEEQELTSDLEEADTKVVLHCLHALQSTVNVVVVRSTSGDTDIIVLMVSLVRECIKRVFIDTDCNKNRHVIRLSNIELSSDRKLALVGLQFIVFLKRQGENTGKL